MLGARRRWSDGLAEARYEAVLALVRTSVCGFGAITLALAGTAGLKAPALFLGLVALASAVAAVGWGQLRSASTARAVGRWSTLVDVLLFGAYSAAYADRPGAGAVYGAFVMLMGPLRYGWRGAVAVSLPVALIAAGWPQRDAAGDALAVSEVLLLGALFTVPALLVRAAVLRGGARLRQAEQQFATAFEHASIGMALVAPDLVVLQANRSLGVLLGIAPAELLGRGFDERVDPYDRGRIQQALGNLSATTPATRLEVRLRRPDGGLRWGHVSASLLGGASGLNPRIVVQVENITERKRSEAMLSHAAAHDALTDLPNRTMLLARLDAALEHGEQVGVLFLDLDRFKVVNDGLGHAAGDLLLVQVAIRLREAMRPDDLVARIGGDEFVVLCRNADLEVTTAVANRVLEVLAQPMATAGGGDLVVGSSIGAALAGPGDSAELALRDADTAMYAAKAAGGGRVHHFAKELRDAVVRTHELEVDMRLAVRTTGLSLVYQPIVDVTLGRVIGCEALVRWSHPVRGPLPPQEFVEVAEQSDLILELGDWVLRHALFDAASWVAPLGVPLPTVSVNVSIRQLLAPGFAAQVRARLEEAEVDATRLCLEVTETALVTDIDQIVLALETLRDVGVHLSIDDFGTGHASLTYLARFPVDQVKVDRSFVAGLGVDAGSAAIIGGVIAMAHTFDLRVVAEGVETEGQLAALQDLGCDAVQGFLLSVPTTPEGIARLIRAQTTAELVPWPRRDPTRPLDAPVSGSSSDEVRRYRLLVEGAREVTGRLDLEAVMDHAFIALGRAVTFTGGAIMLVDGEQVRIAAGLPPPTPEALAARIPLGQGVSGSIASSGEPRYLPDITIASTVTSGRRQSGTSTGVRSWFGVPLIAEGRPIGVLQVDSTEVDAFDEQDRLAVLSFAPVVALAVVCARLAGAQLRAIQDGK